MNVGESAVDKAQIIKEAFLADNRFSTKAFLIPNGTATSNLAFVSFRRRFFNQFKSI